MKRTILALALTALFLAARAQDASAEPKVGDRAASGNLIIHVFHQAKTRKPLPAELVTDYGFMIINLDWEHPKALYRLASRTAGTIQEFNTLAEFEAALAKLPKGAKLTEYNKCLAPTYYGLDFDWRGFKRTCKGLGLKLAAEPESTCNCPSI